LLTQLQPLAGQIRILLDGITVQNEHSITSEIQSRINSCDPLIQQLTSKAGSIPVVNINGLGFSEWLPLASSVDFYVTHEGTMQHKLAWIFPSKVGIFLIGRKNAGSIAKWHRNQSQNSSTVHFYHLPCSSLAISPATAAMSVVEFLKSSISMNQHGIPLT